MTDVSVDQFGFRSPNTAMRLKKLVQQIATQEAGDLMPNQQVARCLSVNLGKLKSDVWIPGDPEPITVNLLPGSIPNDIGDATLFGQQSGDSIKGQGSLVIVEPIHGKQYITRVLSGGQFAYDLGAAGFAHKVLNTTHVTPGQYDHTPPVSGTFGKSFSFFLPANGIEATRIGPLVATGNGTILDGIIKVHLSRGYDMTSWEFEIHDNQLWDSIGHQVCWMRALPKKTGRNGTDSEIALDIGILETSYRDPAGFEIWLRLVELSPQDDVDFTYVNVEAYGPIINIGDPVSGRLLVLDYQFTPTQIGGYFGFHDSNHGYRNRFDEAIAVETPYYNSTAWNSGSWEDSATRLAEQLLPVWSTTGVFTWNGSRLIWTNDIVFSGVGPSHYGLNKGRLNVPMVPSGTRVPVYPLPRNGSIANQSVLADANGIPLEPGDTLYFGIPPGMGNGAADGTTNWHQLKWMFFIVDSETYTQLDFNYKLPQWAIPIAHRTNSSASQIEVFLTAPSAQLIDTSQYVTGVTTTTPGISNVETGVFSASTSMRFKNQCAYRVKFRVHVQGTAVTQTVRFRLRKGNTAAGDIWVDFGQVAINATGVPYGAYFEAYLINTTGADITTQTILTAIASVVSPGITLPGNATNQRRWYEIEYAGPAAKYISQGHAVT